MLNFADNLKLPLDVVTEKLAWLGRTGSGKTYGAMKLAELMLYAGAQIGVIDPVGVWRGLRVPAQKSGESYDVVVFGGLTPDIPIEPTEAAGQVIADFVCDRSLSFVLDVSQLIPSEQQRVVRGFASRFFQRRKANPSAVHLFMEECQEFIPENPSGREEQLTLGVMQRLWKLGRNYGIGGSLISQRPQEVAKKALNMSGTLFAFQMTGPQERKTIRSWVVDHGIAVDIEGVLQTLKRGQPHVEMHIETPGRRVHEHSGVVAILPRVTADLSSTPTVGGSRAARPLTPIDVKELNEQLQATIEKAKADDPRELKRRVAELEAQLKRHKTHTPGRVEPARATKIAELRQQLARHQRALEEAMKILVKIKAVDFSARGGEALEQAAVTAAVRQITAGIEKRITALADRVQTIQASATSTQEAIQTLLTEAIDVSVTVQKQAPFSVKTQATPSTVRSKLTPAPRLEGSPNGHLQPAKQKILNALAWLAWIGRHDVERQVAAFIAGTSSRSSAYENNISALKTAGLIAYPGPNRLQLTAQGAALASAPDTPLTSADLHAQIERLLQPAQWKLVAAAIGVYPRAVSREELAELAHVSAASSAFENNVSRMRSLGLFDYPKQGHVVATSVLFLD